VNIGTTRRENPLRHTLARLLVVLIALTLVAAACGDDDDNASTTGKTTTTAAGAATTDTTAGGEDLSSLSATLNGSGSSFQNNLELAAIDAFTADASGVTINYNSVGSGQGKTDLANQVTDFAGSDSLVKPEDKGSMKGGDFLYFPIAAGPVTVSYNLKGVDLQLSAGTLAGIMQGDIATWDDAKIKADNPDATLPSTKITIVHRSDASGTTSAFTKYLDKASGGVWKLGGGDTVEWPASSQGGEKNTGVAQIIQQTDGAVGYVDFSDAEAVGLTYAKIKNKAGDFVAASLDAASAALAGATINPDLSVDALDASGADSYPITTPTYIIVYKNQTDADKGAAIVAYLRYLLTDGQQVAGGEGYAPLSDELAKKAIDQLDSIKLP
jgi:phosphate transport system substrate-binding protein